MRMCSDRTQRAKKTRNERAVEKEREKQKQKRERRRGGGIRREKKGRRVDR
jgi:hypothetical protein